MPVHCCSQAKIAELEATLAAVSAERAALERQRSAGKPPRAPTSGATSPRGAPSSPFGRSTSGGDAAAGLQVASLEIQVRRVIMCLHGPKFGTTSPPGEPLAVPLAAPAGQQQLRYGCRASSSVSGDTGAPHSVHVCAHAQLLTTMCKVCLSVS